MKLSKELEAKAITYYHKRRKMKCLYIKRAKLESLLARVVYFLFCIFAVLVAYSLGLSHSVL